MIWITQLLCPQRHCIIAAAWDDQEDAAPQVEHQVRTGFFESVKKHELNPFCGICQSRSLHCESGPTKWKTMEEALPHIKREEAKQIADAAILKAQRS